MVNGYRSFISDNKLLPDYKKDFDCILIFLNIFRSASIARWFLGRFSLTIEFTTSNASMTIDLIPLYGVDEFFSVTSACILEAFCCNSKQRATKRSKTGIARSAILFSLVHLMALPLPSKKFSRPVIA